MVNYWMVVDTVRTSEALKQVQSVAALDGVLPLYAGSDFDYLIDQSPLVISLGSSDAIFEQWKTLPLFDSSSVMFSVDSNVDDYELLTHLQNLLSVHIQQTKFLFRFYANTIWQQVAASLNEQDTATILGPAHGLYWLDDGKQVQSFYQQEPAAFASSLPALPYQLTSSIFKQWV